MKRTGNVFAAATAAIVASAFLGGEYAFAGHPFGTEDAGTQGKGNAQVEFDYEYRKDADGTKTSSLANIITMGVAPKVDLIAAYGYDFTRFPDGTDDRGMADVELQLKTSFNEGKDGFPTIGIKGGASLPVEEGGQTTILATAIAEWDFDPFIVFANVGADIGTRLAGNDERTDAIRASLAGSWRAREALFLVSELLWNKQTSPSANATAEWLIGAQWAVTKSILLDAGIRFGLTGDSPDYTYLVGLTLNFAGEKAAGASSAGNPPGGAR